MPTSIYRAIPSCFEAGDTRPSIALRAFFGTLRISMESAMGAIGLGRLKNTVLLTAKEVCS